MAQAETRAWSQVVPGEWLRKTLGLMRDPSIIEGFDPERDLRAQLRGYQREGVRWLWFMTRLGLGACLADDMGLGKTIQTLALLLQLKRETMLTGKWLSRLCWSRRFVVRQLEKRNRAVRTGAGRFLRPSVGNAARTLKEAASGPAH